MLDFKTQSQIVDATASMLRWYVTAAVNTSAASACRSLSLWSELLEATSPRRTPLERAQPASGPIATPTPASPANGMAEPTLRAWAAWPWLPGSIPSTSPLARTWWWVGPNPTWWGPLAGWPAWSRTSLPGWNGWLAQVPPPPTAKAPNGAARPVADSSVASYRSAGGHAVAQVIMGPEPGRPNGRASPKRP